MRYQFGCRINSRANFTDTLRRVHELQLRNCRLMKTTMKHISSALEVARIFLKLGLTSFGGPIAHLGYFREEFVNRRKWLDEKAFADLVALCQFLPGPASSQVGIAIGNLRAGFWGGLSSWVGFTIPSAVALILFGYGAGIIEKTAGAGWLHGLKVVAVAVVAQAVWNMAVSLCPDRPRQTLAVLAALVVFLWRSSLSQIAVIVIAGIAGWRLLHSKQDTTVLQAPALSVRSHPVAMGLLILFFFLMAVLPLLASYFPGSPLVVIASFYRVGSLVFGGGHVVLPLLQAEVVPPGWVTNDAFLAGYGAAQAVPGPLFTFAAYLGTVMSPQPHGWIGGMLCLAAIYLPSFLLVMGALPFWETLRAQAGVQSVLKGVNASVVGLLLAALYDPVWTSAILSVKDFALALICFGMLAIWKIQPWVIVIFAAFVSFLVT
jgi:chromate transporter